MNDQIWRECKGCGSHFYVSRGEERYYTRRRIGNAPMSPPLYCEQCRLKKTERRRVLARSNFPISNSRHGDGCFEELTTSDLDGIDSWRGIPTPESSLLSEEVTKEKNKRQAQYTLVAPSWINEPVGSTGTPIQYPWCSIAVSSPGRHPRAIKFSVEGKLTGLAWLRSLSRGPVLWWLEYAPWATDYENAELSLPFYAIAESIRQGYRGRILVRSTSQNEAFFKLVGCQRVLGGSLLELPAEDAWRWVMSNHGVSKPVIDLLLQQDSVERADVAWIVERVGRGALAPLFIEAFTRLAHGLNWLDVKWLADERGNIPLEEQTLLRHKVRDVMGALAVRCCFEELGAKVQYADDIPVLGQTVQFSDKTPIGCRVIDAVSGAITERSVWLDVDEKAVVISRVWSQEDYYSDKPEDAFELLDQASVLAPHRILAVSKNFDQVPEAQQRFIIFSVGERGAHVYVLPHSVGDLQWEVRDLFRRLDPKIRRFGDSEEQDGSSA